MTISDHINIVLAVVTFIGVGVALYLGVSSSRQTKELRSKDYKQKLLTEIIEWAIEISKCSRDKDIRELAKLEEDKKNDYILVLTGEVKRNFISLMAKSIYIDRISKLFDSKLQAGVETLNQWLASHIKILDESIKRLETDKDKANLSSLGESWFKLDPIVWKVIETAVNNMQSLS